MLGLHNVYKQEYKTPDNIVIIVEEAEQPTDSATKDWKCKSQHRSAVLSPRPTV